MDLLEFKPTPRKTHGPTDEEGKDITHEVFLEGEQIGVIERERKIYMSKFGTDRAFTEYKFISELDENGKPVMYFDGYEDSRLNGMKKGIEDRIKYPEKMRKYHEVY